MFVNGSLKDPRWIICSVYDLIVLQDPPIKKKNIRPTCSLPSVCYSVIGNNNNNTTKGSKMTGVIRVTNPSHGPTELIITAGQVVAINVTVEGFVYTGIRACTPNQESDINYAYAKGQPIVSALTLHVATGETTIVTISDEAEVSITFAIKWLYRTPVSLM